MKNSNESSVKSNGVGSAFAIMVIVVANQFGAGFNSETTAILVGALGTILTFFLPALGTKKKE